ncbi:MAG TPA: DsrE family protein [Flavisolibacter sp.]
MKKIFLLAGLLLAAFVSFAQQDYKVVFDLTSRDTIDHKNVIRWIRGISAEYPGAQLEIVLYGKSLDMITKDKSIVPDAVMSLAAKDNITIAVCAVAMKNNNVEKSQLLPGVTIVPDGIYEIIKKQQQGWGYIKVSK